MPVAVGRPRTVERGAATAGCLEAQLIGQTGQRRGVRAGPAFVEAASRAYTRVEWSGGNDRRLAVGRLIIASV